jgi:protein TonB
VIAAAPRRNRRRILRVAPEAVRRGESPLSPVLGFGSRGHGRWSRPLGAAIIALLFHVVLGTIAGVSHAVSHEEPPPRQQQIAVALERQPPPPPPPPHPPEARSPKMGRPAASKPPPAPAQAGKVIAAAPDPNAPVDMTGFNLVVGEGKNYAGGYSSAKGTSTQAIPDVNARASGRPNAVDQSRTASPMHRDWSCAWPEEEQTSDLRDARVTIRVQLDSDGLPSSVEVLNAPPGGFAAAARNCAEGETYLAAHDVNGKAVPSTTSPFVVHFLR